MNFAMILMAGSGLRLAADRPKQYLEINNKPLFIYTTEGFANHPNIDHLLLVARKEDFAYINETLAKWNINKVLPLVDGGDTRQASVYNGLIALKKLANEDDLILIHDAARPLVSEAIISDNIIKATETGTALTALSTSNTIGVSFDGKSLDNVPNRDELFIIQTPQTFKYKLIFDAHLGALNNQLTNQSDDAQLLLHLNIPVYFVNGSSLNFKVTTKEDFKLLQAVIGDTNHE